MKVLAIAGSLRAGSTNAALVRAIAHLAPQDTTVKIYAGLGDLVVHLCKGQRKKLDCGSHYLIGLLKMAIILHPLRNSTTGDLPLFSPDADTDSPALPVADLRDCIKTANAVIICTPEYAYGMPGALKNALDWLVSSGNLYSKPVAALSASPSQRGGDRALIWLLQTLTALGAEVPNGASFAVPFVQKNCKKN